MSLALVLAIWLGALAGVGSGESESEASTPASRGSLRPTRVTMTRLAYAPATEPTSARSPSLRSRGDGPPTTAEKTRRNEVVEALLQAEAEATERPESAEPALLDALARFADIAPLVARDDYAQSARTYAQLALARTRLVLDRPSDAVIAIDAALRIARGAPLPAAQFGPDLVALVDERVAALAERPPGTLRVTCHLPCRVWVDEQPFETGPLPTGAHRVWIEAKQPGRPVLREDVEIRAGERLDLAYDVPDDPSLDDDPPPVDAAEPVPLAPRRLLPRWASVLGLVAGGAGAGVGGGLVGVDHRCPDLSDPRQVPCLRILDTDAGGITLIALGSVVAVASAVILVIDERRGRRARRPPAGHARLRR